MDSTLRILPLAPTLAQEIRKNKNEKYFSPIGCTINDKKTTWWLPHIYLMNAWCLPDNCYRWWPYEYLTTEWQLPDDCFRTAGELPDNSLDPDDCLTTNWQLICHCSYWLKQLDKTTIKITGLWGCPQLRAAKNPKMLLLEPCWDFPSK